MKKKKKSKLFEWQNKCKETSSRCEWCNDTENLTVDHIVPVHILKEFEIDDYVASYEMEENFRILCRHCNKFKGGHLDLKNPATYLVFDTLLKKCRNKHFDDLSTD